MRILLSIPLVNSESGKSLPPELLQRLNLLERVAKISNGNCLLDRLCLRVCFACSLLKFVCSIINVSAPHLANPTIKLRCYSGRGGGFYP